MRTAIAIVLLVGSACGGVVQKAKLSGPLGSKGQMGHSVGISGGTVASGAPYADNDIGAVYVFLEGDGWQDSYPVAKLTASDGAVGDQIGMSVAISGVVVVAGEYGSNIETHPNKLYVWVKPAEGWHDMTETAQLTTSDGYCCGLQGDWLGWTPGSIAITNGNFIAAVAQMADGGLGAIYEWTKGDGGWVSSTETAKLTSSMGGIGEGVAFNGTTGQGTSILSNGGGEVLLWVEPQTGWTSMTETYDIGTGGGLGAAMTGDTLVEGCDGTTLAQVYTKPQSGWSANLKPQAVLSSNAQFASSHVISMSETHVVIGQPGVNPGKGGAAMIYSRRKGWQDSSTPFTVQPDDWAGGIQFGYSVGIFNGTFVVGSILENEAAGAVYVFSE
jgi:hypothetical protein